MFFGASLVALCANASLLNYLSTKLPDKRDEEGIFERPLKKRYDYIVVGSGSAGSIIATRLSEENVSVLLLEAGGSDYDNDFTRIPLPWRRTHRMKENWNFTTVTQEYASFATSEHKAQATRGRVLGGTGSINGMNYVRGNRHDYDEWAREGCKGWSYKDVLPYFKKSENIQIPELRNSSFHGTSGPLVITQTFTSPLDSLHKLAAIEKGLPVVDCNGANQIGYCPLQANIKDGERCTSSSCFLRPVLSRPNLQVNINSHVARLIIRNGKAKGVKIIRNGKMIKVYGKKEIILSAGVFGSPQILLLSGIGPKAHLDKLKIPVIKDLPVGEQMQDHMQYFFQFSTNTSLNMNKEKALDLQSVIEYVFYKKGIQARPGNDGTVFAHLPSNKNPQSPPDLQLSFKAFANEADSIKCALDKMQKRGDFQGEYRTASVGFAVLICKLKHKSRGTLRLRSKNPLAAPLIDPQYLSHQEDVDSYVENFGGFLEKNTDFAVTIRMVSFVLRFVQQFANNSAWQSIGAKFIRQEECEGYCSTISFDTDDYWQCMIRHYARQANHQVSTCRMGEIGDPTAVVDSYLRVQGIKHLRVADASVMRNIPSANTNAAAMMIGEKAADMIKMARYKKIKRNKHKGKQ